MKYDFDQECLDNLLLNIQKGNVFLFLGAGFSSGGQTYDGKDILLGEGLSKKMIEFADLTVIKHRTLSQIYEASVDKKGKSSVNDFLKHEFIKCKATWHKIVPSFLWKRIYTINIDDLLHDAIKECTKPLQNPVFKNFNDLYDSPIKNDLDDVQIISLHGSVRRASEGFIFGSKEYANAIKENLKWHVNYSADFSTGTFIFIGTQLQEVDLEVYSSYRQMQAPNKGDWEKNSFLITHAVDDVVRHSMKANGIWTIESTAEAFFQYLDANVKNRKKMSEVIAERLPKIAKYTSDRSRKSYITFQTQFRQIIPEDREPMPDASLHDFFAGDLPSWWDIQQNNDAVLSVVYSVRKFVLSDSVKVPIITGAAGCGKTTTLKRVAQEFAKLKWQVYYFQDESFIDVEATIDVLKSTKGAETVVIIDNAAEYIDQVDKIIAKLDREKLKIKVLLAERSNRLERVSDGVVHFELEFIEMDWLNDSDIQLIINKLTEKDKLRTLRGKSNEEMIGFFKNYSNKQLLVAMKELVGGMKFNRIIAKEYLDIQSTLAQSIYATISLCHARKMSVGINTIVRIFMPELNTPELLKMVRSGCLKSIVLYENERLMTRHYLIAEYLLNATELSAKLTGKMKADLLINLMIALSPLVNVNELLKGTPETIIVRNFMDYNHIGHVLGKNLDSIDLFFRKIKDYYDWNSKYWAQRGLFESERERFADAIDFAEYAVSKDSHFTIKNTLGNVYLKSAASQYADTFIKGKELFDKGIEAMEAVLRDRNYTAHKAYNVIFNRTIAFVRKWGVENTQEHINIFERYMVLAKKQKMLRQSEFNSLRQFETQMLTLRLNISK